MIINVTTQFVIIMITSNEKESVMYSIEAIGV